MPKRPHGKSRKDMKNKQNVAQQEEEQSLRQYLKENNLHKRGMSLQEMRDLYTAIEQSKKDHEIHQKISQFDVPYPAKNPLHRMRLLHQDILRQYETERQFIEEPGVLRESSRDLFTSISGSNDTLDLNFRAAFPSPPKAQTSFAVPSVEEFEVHRNIVPRLLRSRNRIIPDLKNVDSDTEGSYSPEFPGPCCRVVHSVQAEIHPEPREVHDQRLYQAGSDSLRNCMNSFRKKVHGNSVSQLHAEWDMIDELV